MKQLYQEIALGELCLDHLNPRLPKSLSNRTDEEVVNWMLSDASLLELMLAIGQNGYFPGEPLLVINEDAKYIVIEGNRRLASLKLLENPSLATRNKSKISRVMSETTYRPDCIPCIVFDSRVDINKYLGFRHVTGVKEWSLLAKARYLTSLLPDFSSLTRYEKYRELAKAIGSRSDYVRRLLIAYELYEEIESNNFFDISGLDEDSIYFNYLSDSLNRQHIRSFIGVNAESEDPLDQLKNEEVYSSNFRSLIIWFFDKSNGKTVIKGDSDTLTKLNTVLSDLSATEQFRQELDLNSAYEKMNMTASSFHQNLSWSRKYLKDAMNQLFIIESVSEPDMDALEDIQKLTKVIKNHLENMLDGEED